MQSYAYQCKYTEAAKAFRKAGDEHLAMQMFTDLRMFDKAKEYVTSGAGGGGLGGGGATPSGVDSDGAKSVIVIKQAEWALRNNDAKSAAELYMSAKQYNKAIDLAGKNNWSEMLLEIVRKLDKADRDSLAKCAEHFKRMQLLNFAAEVYEKMGSIAGSLQVGELLALV